MISVFLFLTINKKYQGFFLKVTFVRFEDGFWYDDLFWTYYFDFEITYDPFDGTIEYAEDSFNPSSLTPNYRNYSMFYEKGFSF